MLKKILKILLNIVEVVAVAAILAFILIKFVLIPVEVEGSSMYPTLINGQKGYSFVISKNIGINRFDIAIIEKTSKDDLLVKRVIGLPGETIEFKDNKLLVNGSVVSQDFLGSDVITDDYGPITLADDEYFCMGDNRSVSVDSRKYGPFKKDKIRATHAFIYSPFENFGYHN